MKAILNLSVNYVGLLFLIVSLLLVGCEQSHSENELHVETRLEEESQFDKARNSFLFQKNTTGLVVNHADELEHDFILVLAMWQTRHDSAEERYRAAQSIAQGDGVDAVIIGTEGRGPDMGDCVFDGKDRIGASTIIAVQYVSESKKEEYRREKKSCIVDKS